MLWQMQGGILVCAVFPVMLLDVCRASSVSLVIKILLDLLEFVAGDIRVASLCGDMRHLPTLIDLLKDQVQEARQSEREFGCSDGLHGEGLAHPGEQGRRSGVGAAPVLRNQARHFDQDAFAGPKRCDHSLDNNMSDARREVCSDNCPGRIPMQALGTFRHPRMLRDGLCANPFTYPQEVLTRARRPARQSLLVRRVPA